ncbi:MAG: DUF4920 domain-containing protein [Deltaproteobacteria bacterium]|nr:DUF4920 domain-containing protein [Deltaproteobacteria bacterium]
MKTFSLFFIMLCLLVTGVSNGEKSGAPATYGSSITLNKSVSLAYAIEHFDEIKNREVLLEGKVSKLCQVKGCWMVLQSEQGAVRVTFKDYGFFVPDDLKGKKVRAQGRLHVEIMEVSQARHFAQDAGKSREEIEKIKEPIKEYRFVATAVEVQP